MANDTPETSWVREKAGEGEGGVEGVGEGGTAGLGKEREGEEQRWGRGVARLEKGAVALGKEREG